MLLVLLTLCAFFSWLTYEEQHPNGAGGAEELAATIAGRFEPGQGVVIVARAKGDDAEYADTLERLLRERGDQVLAVIKGDPPTARGKLEELRAQGKQIDIVAATEASGGWTIYERVPGVGADKVLVPESYYWPNFLKADNLINVASQIVVIAIIAIGMTLVIVTGGIDLSVGSLVALSAVVAALLIERSGKEEATVGAMILACLGAVALCGLLGMATGTLITSFGLPPFIVTLGMMQIARGLAYRLAGGQSVYQVPDDFIWLGRGNSLGVPNAVLLMVALYVIAHIVMTRMTLGRYVYAVGGNPEAARLSGVPVKRVLILVYTLCGVCAGLGGIVLASRLKSGSPTFGQMYELSVIAAVVVGGTSLSGGEGNVIGTLIGAFIIGVIENGMNLMGLQNADQMIVLGGVLLGAVLLDRLSRR